MGLASPVFNWNRFFYKRSSCSYTKF